MLFKVFEYAFEKLVEAEFFLKKKFAKKISDNYVDDIYAKRLKSQQKFK